MSDITLDWLAGKAQDNGLALDVDVLEAGRWDARFAADPTTPDPLAPAGNSYTSFYRLTRPWRRPIGVTSTASESASSSALRRERDDSYRPPNLERYLDGGGQVTPV